MWAIFEDKRNYREFGRSEKISPGVYLSPLGDS